MADSRLPAPSFALVASTPELTHTPPMALLVYFATFALFSVIFTREVIAPASQATCDRRWRLYAGSLNAANLLAVVAAGFLFDRWIDSHSLFALRERLDVVSASLVACAFDREVGPVPQRAHCDHAGVREALQEARLPRLRPVET